MRFLKNKIARAMELANARLLKQIKEEAQEASSASFAKVDQAITMKTEENTSVTTGPCTPKRLPKSPETQVKRKRESNINKNIVKNYARAMVNFALSKVATPYLQELFKKEEYAEMKGFLTFIEAKKEEITSIRRLRDLLVPTEQDDELVQGYKRVFKAIGLIFIRDFTVNWVYSSKISDKLTHLKYRFKMLRRVQNPEFFTYLEDFGARKSA